MKPCIFGASLPFVIGTPTEKKLFMCIKVECTACGLGKGGDLLALAAALSLCWEQKIRGDGRGVIRYKAVLFKRARCF